MESPTPKVSIVVPVYNPGGYFPACLESLEAQTIFDRLEIILVDDGSGDGSEAVCDGFATKHGNALVIHQPNRGVAAARNAGMDAASGDFLLFVDSDDAITPDACERLLAAAESSDADIVWGDYADRSACKGGVAEIAQKGEAIELWRFVKCAISEGSFLFSLCLQLMRSSFVRENGLVLEDWRVFEEQRWIMRCLLNDATVMRVDLPFYIYNIGDHPSLSTKVTSKHLMDAIDAVYAAIDELETADPSPEVREVAEAFIANSIAITAMTYYNRAPRRIRDFARIRMNDRFAYYANRTELLPKAIRTIGPALVSDPELYEVELGRIREAKRKAREAESRTPDA